MWDVSTRMEKLLTLGIAFPINLVNLVLATTHLLDWPEPISAHEKSPVSACAAEHRSYCSRGALCSPRLSFHNYNQDGHMSRGSSFEEAHHQLTS